MRVLFLFLMVSILACNSTSKPSTNSSKFIYLVRHAEKADDGTKDPPLTEEGKMRAQQLVSLLKDKNIQKVYSTDYKRTRETADPLAKELNLEVLIYDPRDSLFHEKLINESKEINMLIVGHSNSTPTLTNKIIGKEKFKNLDESVYNQIFRVEVQDDEVDAFVFDMESIN